MPTDVYAGHGSGHAGQSSLEKGKCNNSTCQSCKDESQNNSHIIWWWGLASVILLAHVKPRIFSEKSDQLTVNVTDPEWKPQCNTEIRPFAGTHAHCAYGKATAVYQCLQAWCSSRAENTVNCLLRRRHALLKAH